jgi:2-polyprenyl-6-methoxyphenol hydroxylase-like FAD-dependent oxidoreductase
MERCSKLMEHCSKQKRIDMTTRVTIVGAGLGGLVLARVLQLNDIPATVYERDGSNEARSQGGQLDLHPDNGQLALEMAGLAAQFRSIVHPGGAAARIVDRHGVVLAETPDDGSMDNPEALRGDIRQVLLDSLHPGTVQWGKKLTSSLPLGDGRHELTFADGTVIVSSTLVGADGVWSRVRPLVSDAIPTYSGLSYIDTYLDDVDRRHAGAAKMVGDGALYALEPGRGFLAHRERGNRVHAYVVLDRSPEWFDAIDFDDVHAVKARLVAEFDGWAGELKALISDADSKPILRAIYELPDDHRWNRSPGVTLIGDAAHATVPGSDGANNAMLDGAELGQLIAAHPDDIDQALATFEETMFVRSAEAAANGHRDVELIFGSGAPHALANLFNGN